MGQKLPRPADIDFPAVQNKIIYQLPLEKRTERVTGFGGQITRIGTSITALKSGNVLLTYFCRDEKKLEMKSYMAIYSVPNFKLVEKYVFDSVVDDVIYVSDYATQLNNGDIFSICDRLYIFDGESIANGPKTTSNEVVESNCLSKTVTFIDPEDKWKVRKINRPSKTFQCDFMLEAKEGIILFTAYSHQFLNLLDIGNLQTEEKTVFQYVLLQKNKVYDIDIVHKSEYFPDNLYIIANSEETGMHKAESILFIFQIDEICNTSKNSQSKTPLQMIQISESQNVYALCEYNEKYLLLDTINNGIYIIDLDSKQKVAVAALKYFMEGQGKLMNIIGNIANNKEKRLKEYQNRFKALYRKMLKLKDGQVLTNEGYFLIADIREQTKRQTMTPTVATAQFVVCGNFLVSYFLDGTICIYRLYDN